MRVYLDTSVYNRPLRENDNGSEGNERTTSYIGSTGSLVGASQPGESGSHLGHLADRPGELADDSRADIRPRDSRNALRKGSSISKQRTLNGSNPSNDRDLIRSIRTIRGRTSAYCRNGRHSTAYRRLIQAGTQPRRDRKPHAGIIPTEDVG